MGLEHALGLDRSLIPGFSFLQLGKLDLMARAAPVLSPGALTPRSRVQSLVASIEANSPREGLQSPGMSQSPKPTAKR